MSVRRVAWGFVAQGYNQSATIVLQLVTTPLLIAAWGTSQYGTWMVVSALPAYLVLADLGFSQSAANDMSMKMAQADHRGAQRVFESLVALYVIAIVPMLCLCAIAVWLLPLADFSANQAATGAHRLAMTFLIGYVAGVIFSSVVTAALRAEGYFGAAIALNTTSRLVEGFGVVAVAWTLQARIDGAAAMMLAARIIATASFIAFLYAKSDFFRIRLARFQASELRRLLWPSLTFLGFPLGNALSLQGILVAIGTFLSPASVTVYATSRTLARLGVNTLGAVNHVFLYEYSVRARNPRATARLALVHFGIEGIGAVFFFGILWSFGALIYRRWLGDRVEFNSVMFMIVLCQSSLEAAWGMFLTPLMALNKHGGVAVSYVIGASIALLIVIGILSAGGSLEHSATILLILFAVLAIDAFFRLRDVLTFASPVPASRNDS